MPTINPDSIELTWVSTITAIREQDWESCFAPDDVLKSYGLHGAAEAANLAGVEFEYLVAAEGGRVVAIVPCFRFDVSLTTIAAAPVAALVAAVRRVFPRFLYLRAFIVGTPVAICKDMLGLRPDVRAPARNDLLRALLREVKAQARRRRCGFVFVKELTGARRAELAPALAEDFQLVESAATTYLYLGEPGRTSYAARLGTKYRSVMRRRLQRLHRAGMRWQVCVDFAPHAAAMHRLYLQVLERSAVRFETLSAEFFAALPCHLGGRAFALLCFKGERLVAFELCLEDEAWLHPLYLGLDYEHRDEGALYFNCIYKLIEVLESRGRSVVQLGQTSYAAKASIGAVVDRLYLAVYHRNRLVRWLLRRFGALFFPPAAIPRSQRVFRDMQENDGGLARHGVVFERGAEEVAP